MELPNQFEYTKLQPSVNTARVVNILSGHHSSTIQCQIKEINLDDPPPYCALSYVWGEYFQGFKISVDQSEISITQNLYNALQHLRSHNETRTFWIDALCINQLDMAEKSAQVRKMQEIYGRSEQVLIWLGPEGNGSASAMMLAATISKYWSDQGLDLMDAEAEFSKHNLADLSALLDACTRTLDSSPVEAFRSLMARDWFQRVWTVQEAAAPVKTKTIQCGDSQIDWWSFIAAAKFLSHAFRRPDLTVYFPDISPLGTTSLRGLFNLDQLQKMIAIGAYQADLPRTLANYRYYKATDPKDKVYALLGLVTEALTENWIYDYSLDYQTVYLKVAEHCLLYQGSLECLGYCNASAQDPGLPTWVPNWNHPSVRHPLAYHAKQKSGIGGPDPKLERMYSPSADVTSKIRHLSFSIPQRPKLITEGICIGRAVTISPPHYQVAVEDSESEILRKWEPGNLQCIYTPTGETILDAFSRTIVADVAKSGPSRERGYGVDWRFWRSIKSYAQPPASSHRRLEWGSLLFATIGRSLVLTDNGYMCLAPGETQPGDQICVLLGGHVLYILRPTGENWSFVGECYVHGLMDGEAMSLLANGTFELQVFTIA